MNKQAGDRSVNRRGVALAVAGCALAVAGLIGCTKDDSSGVTVAGDVPIAYVQRSSAMSANPTNGAPAGQGGDLMVREKSSPSAPEHNVTAAYTQGKGDVSDPEVSYDGKKIVFAMRCPTSNTATIGGQAACTGHWNIWEYDMSTGGLTGGSFRRLTASTEDDDVDPAYLPAGAGFVFSSNRQTKSKNNQALDRTYYALDEYERERVFNLHTMDRDGGKIEQISFNQSHDRNPVVRPNGDIMFSRWDHVAGRNHFKVFRVKPDGTDMFVLYGAHSEGNSFLHPRDMDPKGKYKGFISSDLMPLSGTHEGGALVFVDAANYSEQNTPANALVPAKGGQQQMTAQKLAIERGLSPFGRVTAPYPLWDGTDRVLVAWRPCEVTRNGVVVACAQLSADELNRLSNGDRAMAQAAGDTVQDNVRPNYGIFMFDPANQTMLPIAAPPAGFMFTDPVALQPRTEPNPTSATQVDAALKAQNKGLLAVRSVYDTDSLGRMGDEVLTAADRAACADPIPKVVPTDALDTRKQVADLKRMKDPADPAYDCAPARFIRVFRAVAPPSSTMGLREAIGETEFEPQQILGYAPIEPDGSFQLAVPADTPIGLAVVDAKGRAFQTHTNWIQVRPGETRTCDGCHSPRRGGALNSGAVVEHVPAGLTAALPHEKGETMAATRARLDLTKAVMDLSADMIYTDVWADTAKPGVKARAPITIKYAGNTNAAENLATPVPVKGVINYPEHIQPLWDRARPGGSCVSCHSDPAKLDLRGTVGGTGRLVSYEEIMVGDPLLDANGRPQTRLREGVPELVRGPALVDNGASEGEALGIARKSRLAEIMFGEDMAAGADARTAHPTPATAHGGLLNAAEKRLIAEWMDLGGQYYNDPFDGASKVRTVATLDQKSFEATVYPVITRTCANACHQALGSGAAGGSFAGNRFVLTGDIEGDFNVTLTLVNNTCTPAANYLLSRPSTVPHPAGATTQVTAVLPVGSADYNAISTWIQRGCPTP